MVMFTTSEQLGTRSVRYVNRAFIFCPENVVSFLCLLHLGLQARKPVFGGLGTTNAPTSLRNLHSLISAFVIYLLESVISQLPISEILTS